MNARTKSAKSHLQFKASLEYPPPAPGPFKLHTHSLQQQPPQYTSAHHVGRCLNLHFQYRLHEPRRRHEERRVSAAPGRRDHLPPAAVNGLRRQACVQDFELGVPDGLVAQGAFAAAPLEALHHCRPHLDTRGGVDSGGRKRGTKRRR